MSLMNFMSLRNITRLMAAILMASSVSSPLLSQDIQHPRDSTSSFQVRLVATNNAANASEATHEKQMIRGWTVQVDRRLLASDAQKTTLALKLLTQQLEEIEKVVPAAAVHQLRQVTLWMSPEYPKISPRAEYHPGEGWLRDNGRDPAMVKGIEFTNIRIFQSETRRMPNFTLHELAHAYHDRVLPGGFGNQDLQEIYLRAKAGGKYDRVERRDANGKTTKDRAYAMTNPQEYFAESTEAFFTRNDFYPFHRAELSSTTPRWSHC